MEICFYILGAFLLDCLIGDPRWIFHPVRIVGFLANKTEYISRKLIKWERGAGIFAAFFLVGFGIFTSWALLYLSSQIHQYLLYTVSILLIYFTIAPRDLSSHALKVYRALQMNNLPDARKKVGMIVGRDTDRLDEGEVTRATVETVAESIVDGITAPIFYALLFGPLGAVGYRVINTLDSMFGHKDKKYFYFGWASARIDDVANWIPARITGPLIALVSFFCKLSSANSFKILFRDARKHHSPNSGFPEAAVAGALGVQVGGTNCYNGEMDVKPLIGDPNKSLDKNDIKKAVVLMYSTVSAFVLLGIIIRIAFVSIF